MANASRPSCRPKYVPSPQLFKVRRANDFATHARCQGWEVRIGRIRQEAHRAVAEKKVATPRVPAPKMERMAQIAVPTRPEVIGSERTFRLVDVYFADPKNRLCRAVLGLSPARIPPADVARRRRWPFAHAEGVTCPIVHVAKANLRVQKEDPVF